MEICAKMPPAYITAKHCYAFIADAQTAGQGQHKNTWSSVSGNLHVSYLVKTKISSNQFAAQLAAVSTFQVIQDLFEEQDCSLRPTMKWPNDINVNGKKIGGVLPRAQIKGQDVYLTIGVGVNIGLAPPDQPQATCLNQYLHKPVMIAEFFDILSKRLLQNLARLSQEGFPYLRSLIEPNLEFL